MTLPRPVNSVLESSAHDAEVARGWARVQRKRRVRDTARKSVLVVLSLVFAAAVGAAVRPLLPVRPMALPPPPAVAPSVAASSGGPLDSLVQQLPRTVARGRAVALPRPVVSPAPVVVEPVKVAEPEAEPVDMVAALLESVRDAYDDGNMLRAIALLSEIAEMHPEDPRAAQALYVLGLIQLEKTHDVKGAKESFTRALELSPSPDQVAPLWEALERARAAGR